MRFILRLKKYPVPTIYAQRIKAAYGLHEVFSDADKHDTWSSEAAMLSKSEQWKQKKKG